MIRRDLVAAFEHELWIWFFAGIVRQRLRDRKQEQVAPGASITTPETRPGCEFVETKSSAQSIGAK
jgi:hypothetical protein